MQVNYQETFYDYDYDPDDRPCVYPNDSYSKVVFPENNQFRSLYGSEQNAGGQYLYPDWNNAACTTFLGEC